LVAEKKIPPPPSDSDGYQNKGLAEKWIRKVMKTKDRIFAMQRRLGTNLNQGALKK
jgi:hypothetical protein